MPFKLLQKCIQHAFKLPLKCLQNAFEYLQNAFLVSVSIRKNRGFEPGKPPDFQKNPKIWENVNLSSFFSKRFNKKNRGFESGRFVIVASISGISGNFENQGKSADLNSKCINLQ